MGEHRIKRVLVIGAGTMGAGIAEVAAASGTETQLTDLLPSQLDKARVIIERSLGRAVERGKLPPSAAAATLSRITFTSKVDSFGVDLVIEAVPEDIELKKGLLARVAEQASERTLLATNTSALSVTEIAAAVPGPWRVVGLHFFNPAPIMPLLEVIRAEQTELSTVERACSWAEAIGKTPIMVRDYPGFATSRLGIALGLEAIRMLETRVASARDIDRAIVLGYRHPMGPLELTDLIGLDVRLAIAEHLAKELGERFRPPALLRQLVRAGKLGKKTGEGFYRWIDGRPEPVDR